jgi:hypothetical protein
LPRLSPNTDRIRAPGKKLAVIAMVIVLFKGWYRLRALPAWTVSCNPHDNL